MPTEVFYGYTSDKSQKFITNRANGQRQAIIGEIDNFGGKILISEGLEVEVGVDRGQKDLEYKVFLNGEQALSGILSLHLDKVIIIDNQLSPTTPPISDSFVLYRK